MRTKRPEAGNKFYNPPLNKCITTSNGAPIPYRDPGCLVIPNCVGYACGRFNEIIGEMKYPQFNGDAKTFRSIAERIGLQVSDNPSLGGIMVWSGTKPGAAGHVAIVEEIQSNNRVLISESGYGAKWIFKTRTLTPSMTLSVPYGSANPRWNTGSDGTFLGCVVNPKYGLSSFPGATLLKPGQVDGGDTGGVLEDDLPDKFKNGYKGDASSEGPWGQLVPSFIDVTNGDIWVSIKNYYDEDTGELTHIDTQPNPKTGEVKIKYKYNNNIHNIIWKEQSTGKIRAFRRQGEQTAYIQANPKSEYFGAGTFLQSTEGVDISYIVKQLAKLEGWKTDGDKYIVQTELVPCDDAFKMNNMGAMEFIQEVLVPRAITPTGFYKDKDGKEIKVTSGQAGFVPYFDSNNVFHFEPLAKTLQKDLTKSVLLGYNIPKSPVISFQVDTKGTCFYTTEASKINAMSIVTGQQMDEQSLYSEAMLQEYNKVKGHNENLDEFLGLSYEEVKDKYANKNINNDYWLGFNDATIKKTNTSDSKVCYPVDNLVGSNCTVGQVTITSSLVTSKLVSQLTASGFNTQKDAATSLQNARLKMEQFMVTASLNMYADTRIIPSSIIHVTNMVKSLDSNTTTIHPSSGDYLVLKQKDTISGSEFVQQLSLIRKNAKLDAAINPTQIDYTKDASDTSKNKTDNTNNGINYCPPPTSGAATGAALAEFAKDFNNTIVDTIQGKDGPMCPPQYSTKSNTNTSSKPNYSTNISPNKSLPTLNDQYTLNKFGR